MTVTHRRAAATAVALLALTVTACSDDDDSPEATFTAATEAGDITPADAENASAPTSSAPLRRRVSDNVCGGAAWDRDSGR